MKLYLYVTSSDRKSINKRLNNETSFNIMLKKSESILSPTIPIQTELDLTEYNYAYIDQFKRYYFIEQIEPYPNNIFRLKLYVDVLESFKEDILSSKGLGLDEKSAVNIDILESDVTLSGEVSYILTTLGRE